MNRNIFLLALLFLASTTFIGCRTNDLPDPNVPVTGVTLNPHTLGLVVGDTEALTATVLPENATNRNVSWQSNNTAVATVSNTGEVTARAVGQATITVTTQDGGRTATATVTVTAATISVTGVTLNETELELIVGDTETLIATVLPENATNQNVTWDSSDTDVATVDDDGIVTAVTVGTATITVTTADGTHTATATVTVTPQPCPFENSLLDMVRVEGGTFTMDGNTQDAINPNMSSYIDIPGWGRTTTVSSFWLSNAPITQAQYEYVMGVNPAYLQAANNPAYAHPNASARPVESVTWFEAIAFANKLSLMEGREPVYHIEGMSNADWRNITHADVATRVAANRTAWDAVTQNLTASGFRLPTKAEWEFAARGGTKSESAQGRGLDFFFSNGNDGNNVWQRENPNFDGFAITHPVRHFSPNALGLYDMSGNVWEWNWDTTCRYDTYPVDPETSEFRWARGGSFWNFATNSHVRSAIFAPPTVREPIFGFRLASGLVE